MSPVPGEGPLLPGFEAFDQLATMVAVTQPDGQCLRANSALENTLGASRRALQRSNVFDWLVDPAPLRDTLQMVAANQVATSRFDALMKRSTLGSAGAAADAGLTATP